MRHYRCARNSSNRVPRSTFCFFTLGDSSARAWRRCHRHPVYAKKVAASAARLSVCCDQASGAACGRLTVRFVWLPQHAAIFDLRFRLAPQIENVEHFQTVFLDRKRYISDCIRNAISAQIEKGTFLISKSDRTRIGLKHDRN